MLDAAALDAAALGVGAGCVGDDVPVREGPTCGAFAVRAGFRVGKR